MRGELKRKKKTLLMRTCCFAAVVRELTSETIMAMMRLIMMREPKIMRPIRSVIVKNNVRRSSSLELSYRVSNSNSPRIITMVFNRDLPGFLKFSLLLPKLIMKNAKPKAMTIMIKETAPWIILLVME